MLSVADAPKSKAKKTPKTRQPRHVDAARVISHLQKIRPKYCDAGLLAAVLGVCVFGILMVYSASKYNAVVYYGDGFYYAFKQIIGFFMGVIGLTAVYFIDYKKIHKYAFVIFGIAVLLLAAVLIPGIGKSKLGATRWIGVGSFSVQPSEIAKFAFVLLAARIFSTRYSCNRVHNNHYRLSTPTLWQTLSVLLAGGVVCLLIILEPNMSITMCVGIVMFVMLFLCGVPLKTLGIIVLPALLLAAGMLIAEPYRLKRLSAFADPWANPKDEGFQLIESLYSIANGGFFGVGYGNSIQKYMFLPFSESDFIFAIIAEEFGLTGCVLLFSAFAYIVYKIFAIGRKCPDFFGRYLCYGIAAVILVQSAINFAVATGCIPPTGLPLPFVSFGGTSLFVFMTAIGVVLNVDKQNKRNVCFFCA